MKLLKNHKKPSPTYQYDFSDSARNPKISREGGKSRQSATSCFIEGISLPASFRKGLNAGMTVEASLVLPLFLFFFLNIGSAIEMIRLHGNLQLALWQIGSQLSVYGYALDSGELPEPEAGDSVEEGSESVWWRNMAGVVFASTYVKSRLTDLAGNEYLSRSPLKNGADSLLLWESEIFGDEDTIDLVVTYSVSSGGGLAGFPSFRMVNRYYAHIWNGYRLSGEDKEGETQIVFVTENASVYHLDRDCTHLLLSVRQIPVSALGEARNKYGGRYQACEKCVRDDQAVLCYITESGNRYHYVRECSGLKRTIYSISLKEAEGYRPCSRCGRKRE